MPYPRTTITVSVSVGRETTATQNAVRMSGVGLLDTTEAVTILPRNDKEVRVWVLTKGDTRRRRRLRGLWGVIRDNDAIGIRFHRQCSQERVDQLVGVSAGKRMQHCLAPCVEGVTHVAVAPGQR